MSVTYREVRAADAQRCGEIVYSAFKTINEKHGFLPDIPSPEVGVGFITMLVNHPGWHGIVAESGGNVVGSNFIDERDAIAGIGPITIDPKSQDRSIGRTLMERALKRVAEKRFAGVRLIQAAFHSRSMSLYTKLGFVVREPLVTIQGTVPKLTIPGCKVRAASDSDLPRCNELCLRVHGHDRAGELGDAIKQQHATVVERNGRITGYSTVIGFFGHTLGETNDDVAALIGAAREIQGPGLLLPTRNAQLFRWCLSNGLRVMQPMTLMTMGLYNEPVGAFLPSILY